MGSLPTGSPEKEGLTMADAKSVAEQVAELRARWNPPPVDRTMDFVLGKRPEVGDTRVTDHVDPSEFHPHVVAEDEDSDVYEDDLTEDEDSEDEGYEAMTVEELKDELEERGLPKSGNKAELVARLEEDDASEE